MHDISGSMYTAVRKSFSYEST